MCPFLFENGDFFFNGLTYRPHVSGENGHGKRIFSKTLFGVEILENAENWGFRIRRCRSSYTTSITHTLWGMLSCFHRFEYSTCGFFRKRKGKIFVLKNYPDTCGRGPENPAPLPAPWQAFILDISQPIHTRAIKFALLHLTLRYVSLLYIWCC